MELLLLAVIGLLGGLSSGLFGIGGGTIFVPLLILWRHFDAHLAIGTSIAVVVPTAIAATLRHSGSGMVAWKTVLLIAVFAMVGAWLGSELSLRLPVGVLRRAFAVFLMLVSLKLFFQH